MVAVVTNNVVRVFRNEKDAMDIYEKFVSLKLPVLMVADNIDVISPVYLFACDYSALLNTYNIHTQAIEKGISNIVNDLKRSIQWVF